MKEIKMLITVVLALIAWNFSAAQTEDVIIHREIVQEGEEFEAPIDPIETAPFPGSFVFISSLFEMGDKVVKKSAYSADATTERVQTLSDGNRIVHKNNSQVFRDSEGRIRREREFGMIGNWVSAETPERTIFINDPVAGVHYVLHPAKQTARKMKLEKRAFGPEASGVELEDEEVVAGPPIRHEMREKVRMKLNAENVRKESLGKQTIEGLEVEGSRSVTVIPAGAMGNERPIEMITEKWYSPELKLYVMTRHTDPRFGETTYRLTNIKRGDPDPSLFQVPAGYKIEEGLLPRMKFRKKLQ